MRQTSGPLVLQDELGQRHVGEWFLEGEILRWVVDGRERRIDSNRHLLREVKKVLKAGTAMGDGRNYSLVACATCRHFECKGLAIEMGRAQCGICTLHPWNVEICFLCDDYERDEEDQ